MSLPLRYALASFATLSVAGVAFATGTPAELSAEVACRAEPSARRVLCSVTLAPEAGRRLAWADALVLEAPAASPPLRARVASRRDAPQRLVVSFVLGEATGHAKLLARAVACPLVEGGACRTATLPLEVELPVLASP